MLRLQLAARLLGWGKSFHDFSAALALQRERLPVLVFLHGYALAHTIRPLVVARSLRDRGYPVVLAGRGPHVVRARQEGFTVHDVETLTQSRMDQYVSRGDYGYYDHEWIDRCVRSERTLIQMLRPALVIHDMKPTAALSARLEGVDDARITQAYNQPGYISPVDLPAYFDTASGPFDEYLAGRASEVQPQQSFQIIADVPQFHPPGRDAGAQNYVGPLLDRPPEPAKLEILDAGWDTSLPLIYLTCGSSGRGADYLDELVEALASQPLRVLITTAGRWAPRHAEGHRTIGNVRITDFLPGEWALSRAEMLVGVIGIGAIYQALTHGVPIVGSPEHLDQEIHLSQVVAHGLGIKIDRADFGAASLLPAIERVLREREMYRRRAAPFAFALAELNDASAVANLVDAHFSRSDGRYAVDVKSQMLVADFVRYLESTTPPGLTASALSSLISRGLSRGMPHAQRQGKLYVDPIDSWNWLNEQEPRFFEADYRALEQRRQGFFVLANVGVSSRATVQHYRATYTVRLLPDEAAAARRLKLFLPFPIARGVHQSQVRLTDCMPADLGESLAPEAGFLYGHSVMLGSEPAEFSYTCEYTARELSPERPLAPTRLSAAETQQHLELDPRIPRLPEVIQFLGGLQLPEESAGLQRARAIYETLIATKRFRKTRDRTHNALYCTAAVLRNEGAHCVTLTRAYVSLCRASGIPAREVTGALMGYPAAGGAFVRRAYCEPIFGHQWAEIHIDGLGWLPVEFHALVIGTAAMTGSNVSDRRLRRTIRDNTFAYADYYFGHVDHQRIVCSNSVKQMAQWLVEDASQDVERGERRWRPDPHLRYECALRVEMV